MSCSSPPHAAPGNVFAANRAARRYDVSANAKCGVWNATAVAPGRIRGVSALRRPALGNVVTYFAAWFRRVCCLYPQRQRKERVDWSVQAPVSFL
jgi:hypothetical protein